MKLEPNRPDRTGRLLHGTLEKFNLDAVIKLVESEDIYRQTGRNALTLVKNETTRIVMICLQKEAQMQEHHAPGTFTLNLLKGRLNFTLDLNNTTTVTELAQGQFLVLEEPRPHTVVALKESAFLLTIIVSK